MPRKPTGGVYESRGKWYARVTCGERISVALPFATDEETALTELPLLSDVATRLRAAGQSALAEDILTKLAAREGTARSDVLAAVDVIVAGNTKAIRKGTDTSIQAIAKRWYRGELAKEHPDYIKAKRSASDDEVVFTKWIDPVIGPTPIEALTLDDALLVMSKLPETLSGSRRRAVAQALSKVVSLAIFPLRIMKVSPLPKGWLPRRGDEKKSDCLWPDEEADLLACRAVPLEYRLFYGVIARQGFRATEAASLQWRDVDLDRGIITLDENKTDDPRAWPMEEPTRLALTAWKARRPKARSDDPVFVNAAGESFVRISGSDDQPECTIRPELYREHLKLAKITRERLYESSKVWRQTNIHSIRGLFVTAALANGRTESWVSARTGHGSHAMIERYRRHAKTLQEAEMRHRDLVDLCVALGLGADQKDPQKAATETEGEPASKKPAEIPATSKAVALVGAAGFEAADSDPSEVERRNRRETEARRDSGQPTEERASISPPFQLGVIDALAFALTEAAKAGRFDVVAQLATELQARRLQADGVVSLVGKRGAR